MNHAPDRRVHVIGGPGSGKTTFARKVAAGRTAASIDLDHLAYDQGAGAKRSLAERQASLASVLQRPDWITEGMYLWWIDDLLRDADTIVWLDVPFRIAAWRIVARHIRADLTGTNQHPGAARLLAFLRHVHSYYADTSLAPPVAPDDDGAVTRAHTAVELRAYQEKVLRIPAGRG